MKLFRKVLFRGLWMLVVLLVLAPFFVPLEPLRQDLTRSLLPPGSGNLLGTDELGRDYLSRLLSGGGISLSIAFLSVGGGLVAGGLIGLVSGYFGGLIDAFLMRIMDVLLVFPGFLLALATAAIVGPGYWNLVLSVGVFSIPIFARVIRSSVLSVREREFIEAAQACGVGPLRIMLCHILPNSIRPVMVVATNRLGSAILISGGLSFLGLGIQPPSPEWGAMLAAGRQYLWIAPHLVIFPGMAIFISALIFNILGEVSDE